MRRERATAPKLPRLQCPQARAQFGVALIEALISILIFSFGVLGLIGLEARAINFSVDAEDRNRAALFASEVASNMWLNNSVAVNATSVPTLATLQAAVADPTKTGLPNGTLAVNPVASITNASGTVIGADIVITWQPPSDGSTVTPATQSTLTTRVILP